MGLLVISLENLWNHTKVIKKKKQKVFSLKNLWNHTKVIKKKNKPSFIPFIKVSNERQTWLV